MMGYVVYRGTSKREFERAVATWYLEGYPPQTSTAPTVRGKKTIYTVRVYNEQEESLPPGEYGFIMPKIYCEVDNSECKGEVAKTSHDVYVCERYL